MNISTENFLSQDTLTNIYRKLFPQYEIFSHLDKLLITFVKDEDYEPYKPSEKAIELVTKELKIEKSILIFPRNRSGLFKIRNLNIDFYGDLLEELYCEFPNHKIVSIGSKNGAFALSDHFSNYNIIDLVKYDDDMTLEILVAICVLKRCDFTVGPQSGLSKISLLCRIPSYMIGNRKEKHIEGDNWTKTTVGFFELNHVRRNGQFCFRDDMHQSDCIGDIVRFGKKSIMEMSVRRI
jgi:hypothetical protein